MKIQQKKLYSITSIMALATIYCAKMAGGIDFAEQFNSNVFRFEIQIRHLFSIHYIALNYICISFFLFFFLLSSSKE